MWTRKSNDIAAFIKNFERVRMNGRWCVKQHQWHETLLLLFLIQQSYTGDKDLGKGGLYNIADKSPTWLEKTPLEQKSSYLLSLSTVYGITLEKGATCRSFRDCWSVLKNFIKARCSLFRLKATWLHRSSANLCGRLHYCCNNWKPKKGGRQKEHNKTGTKVRSSMQY